MTDFDFKQAQARANQLVGSRYPIKGEAPKPRTITEVSAERAAEKELEAIAPKTGYPELDQILRGFIPGRLYTLTGNENVGKTSLACNFAVRVAKQGKKVLYFALEPENLVVDYIASVRFDKKFEDLSHEDVSFDDGNIHILGKAEVANLNDLVNAVERLERYDLIVIDHIGYFVNGERQNWIQEQSNAVKRLAGLAKRKKTAIMMIAHLRKPPPGSRKNYVPTSNDISGSGSFKQDSTDVMIVVRQVTNPEEGGLEYVPEGMLYVTKTKSGPNGWINLKFSERKANITSFQEAMQNEMIAQKLKEIENSKPISDQAEIDEKW